MNVTTRNTCIAFSIVLVQLISAPAASLAQDDFRFPGWVSRSMRELAQLREQQLQERAYFEAAEDDLEAERRELADIELDRFVRWMANGEQGPCPIQFDMSLPSPYYNTPAMKEFFARHPEAVKPCAPVDMIYIPTPDAYAGMMQLLHQFRNGSLAPAPMPMYVPGQYDSGLAPAPMPMYVPCQYGF